SQSTTDPHSTNPKGREWLTLVDDFYKRFEATQQTLEAILATFIEIRECFDAGNGEVGYLPNPGDQVGPIRKFSRSERTLPIGMDEEFHIVLLIRNKTTVFDVNLQNGSARAIIDGVVQNSVKLTEP
ncbi:hypothetical protein H0H93_001301, partial [Arthromyces matolae]